MSSKYRIGKFISSQWICSHIVQRGLEIRHQRVWSNDNAKMWRNSGTDRDLDWCRSLFVASSWLSWPLIQPWSLHMSCWKCFDASSRTMRFVRSQTRRWHCWLVLHWISWCQLDFLRNTLFSDVSPWGCWIVWFWIGFSIDFKKHVWWLDGF